MESPPTHQATLPPHAVEERKKDDNTTEDDAVQVAIPVPECTHAQEESYAVVDTLLEITIKSGAAETESEPFETSSAKTVGAENRQNCGANVDMPADSTAENAGAKVTSQTSGIAESESKVVEQPQVAPPTMPKLPATEEPAEDTKVPAEPESTVHGFTPAEAETIYKSEEEDGKRALQSYKADADAEKTVQFIGEAVIDGVGLVASDATAGIQYHKEASNKDKIAGEIVEVLASKLAQAQTRSCVKTTTSDYANETADADDKVEGLTSSQVPDEPQAIRHANITTPINATSVGQDTEAVGESDSAGQGPFPVSSTENMQNGETKPCKGQGCLAGAPNNGEEKILEAEAVQEKIDNGSPSDDVSSAMEVAVTSEVVEQIKRRTLQGLLIAEKNTEKQATGDQPTDSIATSNATAAQEFDSNYFVDKTPGLCKENIPADSSDMVVAIAETDKAAEVTEYSTIIEQKVKGSVVEDAKASAEDTKDVAERDLGNIYNEEEKQGEAHKSDSTLPMKPSQGHSINIMSKVKHSIVKVKKVIIGKSLSSKTLTPPIEAGEIHVK